MLSFTGANNFVERWQRGGSEEQDKQTFWNEFFRDVLDDKNVYDFAEFEKPVYVDGRYNGPKTKEVANKDQLSLDLPQKFSKKRTSRKKIDVYVKSAHTLIEHKSRGCNLDKKINQGDGAELTPLEQADRYNINLPYSERARYIITCNFDTFRIYDTDKKLNFGMKTLLLFNLKNCLKSSQPSVFF